MTQNPVSTASLQAHADALLGAGDVGGAIMAYRALLDRVPARADAWYNLGYLQRVQRDFAGALDSYSRALACGVSGPEAVHVNRAAILAEHFHDPDAAEVELGKAIAANPAFVPAWLNLGLSGEDRGDAAAARLAYAEAARIDPACGRAHARLAALDVIAGDAASAATRLDALLTRPLPPAEAAEIGFALGHARDATGDYDAAFAAFVRANRTAQALVPPPLRYDRVAHDRLIDDLIRAFPHGHRHAAPLGGDPPLFVCGMFRSGSTLCERLLARHSRVTAGGELETIPALVAARLQPYPAAVAALPDAMLDELRSDVLRDVQARFPAADVLTDKLCANFLHIGLIKTLFPDAKIIHTRRHALDNILSVFFLYFDDSISYGFALDDAVHYYRGYRRLMDHWRMLYADDIFDFDYDAVVRDPEPAMRGLLEFCGLEPEAACLAGQAAEGAVRTASAWAVRQPLNDRSSGRWRNYAAHIPNAIAALDGY
ncbi:sulfotransferase [Sphingomonas sp. SUN039]|uniref:tetratricopeptide repeat-containing sulfotransferase family protein n=1 Tax=Sphingomonas sp. SUN039 TaxID=2937787 RepID=UPI0021643094|nr:sulfotransferase [Sphingomonas sp. SUN039]UVO54924.1 sulfotransferase [Sphingomonas sp. SUN039]